MKNSFVLFFIAAIMVFSSVTVIAQIQTDREKIWSKIKTDASFNSSTARNQRIYTFKSVKIYSV